MEHLQAENRKRYDYREFLRKFSVLKEEMQVAMDSFDPIYYNLGLELYGNMPLIEPLETKEMKKIEDFVIVLDTSMSCNGSLIRRFLEETYSVLSESESFFRKIQVHIIQCDEKIQDDQVIHDQREMESVSPGLYNPGIWQDRFSSGICLCGSASENGQLSAAARTSVLYRWIWDVPGEDAAV